MKHLLNILLSFFVTSAIILTSCNSNKDKDKSPHEILVSVGKWKIFRIESRPLNGSVWTVEQFESCKADDICTFLSDGTGTFDEGGTKCDPSEPQTRDGFWSVSTDGKKLTISDASFSLVGEIEAISESQLIVIGYDLGDSGDYHRLTFTPR